jgi:MYXO-CTERM domain-containing protein
MSGFLSSPFKRSLAAAVLLGSVYVTAASATTIDFGAIPQGPIDGVTVGDVSFSYTEFGSHSLEAQASTDITGTTQFIDSPALTGPTDGVLTMSFANPIGTISFAVAETTDQPLTAGFFVSLYDASGNLLETDPIATNPNVLFSEGQFSYTGTAASTVAISFDAADANTFAMGPVSYNLPEPGDTATFTVGLLALGTLVAMRRRRA